MAKYRVVIAAANQIVDGVHFSHLKGAVIDLTGDDEKRLVELGAVERVNRGGRPSNADKAAAAAQSGQGDDTSSNDDPGPDQGSE